MNDSQKDCNFYLIDGGKDRYYLPVFFWEERLNKEANINISS